MHLVVTSFSHTWPPFVLILGLLMVGHVASQDGLFSFIGERCAQLPGSDIWLFLVVMVAVAFVTATLNLDTGVVFMTPVALEAARRRHADVTAFSYGSLLVVNAASLLLLGSNLTNLLVVSSQPVGGATFAAHMVVAWTASVGATITVVMAWRWRALRRPRTRPERSAAPLHVGPGVVAVVAVIVAMTVTTQPAPVVIVIGVVVELVAAVSGHRHRLAQVIRVVNLPIVVPLFVLAVAVGWLGRVWSWPSQLLAHAGTVETTAVAGLGSLLINNLPAASLFASHRVGHPYALLVGLDVGPNLFVTGAMSTMLWWRITKQLDAPARLATFMGVGVPAGLLAMAAAVVWL